MQTLIDDIKAQRWRRPIILAGATLITFALVLSLARIAAAPTLELLYARLQPEDASRILTDLEGRGVAHELRGDSIYVDASARDRLRLDLAAEGLPGGEGAGYELLDSLTGFGTTSQMFDAALTRAREGELARTLLAGRGVAAARVHIADAPRSPFSREIGATASVTIMMKSGDVPTDLAEAAQSLVSGAVSGLDLSDVIVVDARSGRVVSRDGEGAAGMAREGRLAEMRASVDRILAARVGPGRFVAEVSLETSTEEELTRQRVLDPASRVIISTDTQESSASGTEPAGQGVTVASNLPDGDAAGGEGGQSSSADTRERINYEVSETERQVTRGAGGVERITVAVMVDGISEENAAGEVQWTPRPDAELAVIAELVQSAVGYREDRGDVVTVRTLRFDTPLVPGIEAQSAPWISGAQTARLLTVGALLIAVLGIAAFVIRPLLTAAAATAPMQPPQALPASEARGFEALPPPGGAALDSGLPQLGSSPANDLPALSDLPDLDGMDFSGGADVGADDPVDRLRQLIADRRDETVDVLKGWIEETQPEEERT